VTDDTQHRPRASEVRTFLIADIRGYTQYTHAHGDDAASELAAAFARTVRDAMPAWDGELLELRGDEALCVFVSARRALGAAVDLQARFRRPAEGEPLALGVGMGLDAGEALPTEGGYRGGALNLAARLCARAHAGEILASEQVVHLARRIEGMRFGSPHAMRFKGIEEQVRVVRVIPGEDLPPPPSTEKRRGSRTRWLVLCGVAAVAVVTAVAIAVSRGSGSTAEAAAPFSAEVASSRFLGKARTLVASGGAGTYVAQRTGLGAGDVQRIAPSGRTLGPEQPIAIVPLGMSVVSDGALIVGVTSFHATHAVLLRVPVYGSTTEQTIPQMPDCADIGLISCTPVQGGGAVWVASGETVYRFTSNHPTPNTFNLGGRIFDVVYGSGHLWALVGSTLVRLDPATGATARLDLRPASGPPAQPQYIVAEGGDLWISAFSSDTSNNRLIHVETYQPTLRVASSVRYPGLGQIEAAGSGSLWVASSLGYHHLTRLDVRSGQDTGPMVSLKDTPRWIAPAGAQVWLGTYRSTDATRRLVRVQLSRTS
jgi:class 3 adenylate cyclase